MATDDHELTQLRRRLAALTDEARSNDEAWRRAQSREMTVSIGAAEHGGGEGDEDLKVAQRLLARGASPCPRPRPGGRNAVGRAVNS